MRNRSSNEGSASWLWPLESGGPPNESGAPAGLPVSLGPAGGRGMALLWSPGSSRAPGHETLLTALMVALMLTTVAGNALVILAFVTDRGLRTHANFFFLNLAIADFLVGGFCMPLYVPYVLTGEWRLGRGLCKLWLVMDYLLCTVSVFNILLISFDRFLSVTKAVSYRAQQCMTRRAVLKMLSVWLAAFLLYGPPIIAWEHVVGRSVVPPGQCYVEFYYNWYFLIAASTLEFFTPLAGITYFNLMIYSNIRRRNARNAVRGDAARAPPAVPSPPRRPAASALHAAAVFFVREGPAEQKVKTSPRADPPTQRASRDGGKGRRRFARAFAGDRPSKGCQGAEDASPSAAWTRGTTCAPPPAEAFSSSASARVARPVAPRAAPRPPLAHPADPRLRLSRDKRVAKSLAVIVCVFAACWAPYTLLMIIRAACHSRCVDDRLYELSFWLLWLNSAVNPVLYPLCHVRFKRAFLRILCRRKLKVKPEVVPRLRC